MARRTQAEAEKTRRKIISSALELFSRKGYDKTTFIDIAQKLKMTKGAVYWHFKSKSDLLKVIIEEATFKFQNDIGFVGLGEDISFMMLAKRMVDKALIMVNDPESLRVFILLKTQIKWSDNSFAKLREELLLANTIGPLEVFKRVIENGIKKGEIRKDVRANELSLSLFAMWDGLIQLHIDKFLSCDLRDALMQMYETVWQSISVENLKKKGK
jgi:AcrR family transcriptional regulator